ncbi:MAG: hypothetical protein WDW38_007057 [Sanguina aurantia]
MDYWRVGAFKESSVVTQTSQLKNDRSKLRRKVLPLCSPKAPDGSSFRVLQWNILADGLAQSGDFVKTPSNVLEWGYRAPLVLAEIVESGAELICLQELNHYGELLAALEPLGYAGAFLAKSYSAAERYNCPPDGVAIFYSKRRFDCVGHARGECTLWGCSQHRAGPIPHSKRHAWVTGERGPLSRGVVTPPPPPGHLERKRPTPAVCVVRHAGLVSKHRVKMKRVQQCTHAFPPGPAHHRATVDDPPLIRSARHPSVRSSEGFPGHRDPCPSQLPTQMLWVPRPPSVLAALRASWCPDTTTSHPPAKPTDTPGRRPMVPRHHRIAPPPAKPTETPGRRPMLTHAQCDSDRLVRAPPTGRTFLDSQGRKQSQGYLQLMLHDRVVGHDLLLVTTHLKAKEGASEEGTRLRQVGAAATLSSRRVRLVRVEGCSSQGHTRECFGGEVARHWFTHRECFGGGGCFSHEHHTSTAERRACTTVAADRDTRCGWVDPTGAANPREGTISCVEGVVQARLI